MAMSLKPVIYVAGVYSDGLRLPQDEMDRNLKTMDYYARELSNLGWAVIHPIQNEKFFVTTPSYEVIMRTDLSIIARCNAVFFCPGWEEGEGARREHDFATSRGMKIMYSLLAPRGTQ